MYSLMATLASFSVIYFLASSSFFLSLAPPPIAEVVFALGATFFSSLAPAGFPLAATTTLGFPSRVRFFDSFLVGGFLVLPPFYSSSESSGSDALSSDSSEANPATSESLSLPLKSSSLESSSLVPKPARLLVFFTSTGALSGLEVSLDFSVSSLLKSPTMSRDSSSSLSSAYYSKIITWEILTETGLDLFLPALAVALVRAEEEAFLASSLTSSASLVLRTFLTG